MSYKEHYPAAWLVEGGTPIDSPRTLDADWQEANAAVSLAVDYHDGDVSWMIVDNVTGQVLVESDSRMKVLEYLDNYMFHTEGFWHA